jgi:6-phosphogluconate dehydrogenase
VLFGSKESFRGDRGKLIDSVRDALYVSKIAAYAQGMALLRAASEAYSYGLKLSEIATIWRGGCIIRAKLLNRIGQAYVRNPELPNLLIDEDLRSDVAARQASLRYVVQTAAALGIPCLGFASALSYYDGYRAERLPANLTQAQRDYFGAHTFRRVDQEGVFHADWS